MVRSSSQRFFPIPALPESETFHLLSAVTHRRIAVNPSMQIDIHQLLHVSANNLVGINKDNFVKRHREKNIEEKDFISDR